MLTFSLIQGAYKDYIQIGLEISHGELIGAGA